MQILFGCILVSVAHCNVLRTFPIDHISAHQGSTDSIDEEINSYMALSDRNSYDDELDIFSQINQIYLDKLNSRMLGEHEQPPNYRQTAYLLVKTTRQRDKRYINYLTLCHFKICNMGRKRTTRYFHMIRTLDGKDAP